MVTCSVCGKSHPRSETEVFFKRPDPYLKIPAAERETRSKADDDLCMIDKARFFVRGLLPIPIRGRKDEYCWGVWAEVAEKDFRRILEVWRAPDQAEEPPIEATLANEMPYYRDTYGLRISLRMTGTTTRPLFTLVDSHPFIAQQQREGVEATELGAFLHSTKAGV